MGMISTINTYFNLNGEHKNGGSGQIAFPGISAEQAAAGPAAGGKAAAGISLSGEPVLTDRFVPGEKAGYGRPADSMEALFPKDSAAISQDWENQVNWQAETQKVIGNLQKSFPGVQILYSSGSMNQKELSNLAAALGRGSHLILSEDFLKQMASGSEGFEKGKAALTNALTALAAEQNPAAAGKGAYLQAEQKMAWTLSEPKQEEAPKPKWQQDAEQAKSMLEQMKKAQEDAKKNKKDFRVKTSKTDYQTAASYARLAAAGSKSGIQGVMSDARRKIANLKTASALGDSSERAKAKAAIRSYETLLMRGNRKIRRLNEEELTRLRKKRAEQKEQKEKALAAKLEMNRQRTKRRTADRMLVEEGKLYDRNGIIQSAHRRGKYDPRDEYDELANAAYIPSVPSMDTAAVGTGMGMSTGTGGGFTAADVTVTIE